MRLNKFFSFRAALLFLISTLFYGGVFLLFPTDSLAQAASTLSIPLNRPLISQTNITLRQGVQYRITAQGSGSVGDVLGNQVRVDARFFITGSPLQGVMRPQMPLSVNGAAGASYCAGFTNNPTMSPCLIYLALNATGNAMQSQMQPAQQSRNFQLSNAVLMQQFAFMPDRNNDMFNPNSAYVATMTGANLPLQAVFVDRLGFNGNAAYGDNQDTLSLRVVRISPEFAIMARPSFAVASLQPARVINDDSQTQILRDTILDFGAFLTGSNQQIRRFTIVNRGLEPLSVRMQGQDPLGFFTVSSPSGDLSTERFVNTGDSLVIFCTYQPRTEGTQNLDIVFFTNDPALAQSGQNRFRLRLTGKNGTNGVSGGSGSFPVVNDTLSFPVSTGEAPSRAFPPILGTFTFQRSGDNQTSFSLDTLLRTLPSPFELLPGALTTLPVGFDPNTNPRFTQAIAFRPTQFGDFLDSIIFRGTNMSDYKLFLRGRADLADAAIERLVEPLDGDVLSLGSLATGSSSTQTVRVRNTGNMPLLVQTFMSASPNAAPADANEFVSPQSNLNLSAITGSALQVGVSYTAAPNFAPGAKEVFFFVLVRNPVTGTIVAQRQYTVRAVRLPNVIQAARSVINFDSVYVGFERRDTTLLRNVSLTETAILQRQSVTSLTSQASTAFRVDALSADTLRRRFTMGARGEAAFGFRPAMRGLDSAEYRLESLVESTRGSEMLALRLRGVGVEQQFDVESATADSMNSSAIMPVSVGLTANGSRRFSIRLGCVRVGLSRTVRIAFRNNGNLPFMLWSQRRELSGNQSADAAFTLLQSMNASRAVPVGGADSTLQLRFAPQGRGEHRFEYVLVSNIKRAARIPTAPDAAEQIIIEVLGEGITQDASVSASELVFPDNPIGSGCSVQNTLPLVVSNATVSQCGTPLSYSARILEANTPFSMPFASISGLLEAASATTLSVSFSPTMLGNYAATLVLTTDAPAPKNEIRIPLRGQAINQPNVIVALPSIRAASGRRIAVPILVRPAQTGLDFLNRRALSFVKTATMNLEFDASLLRYVDFTRLRTASEVAQVNVTPRLDTRSGITTLSIAITAQDSALIPNLETLLILNFDTYLGRVAQTSLGLSNIRLADAQNGTSCLRVRLESSSNGTFALDSVCGLAAKVQYLSSVRAFALSEIHPNPVSDKMKVGFSVAYSTRVLVDILDALGQVKAVVTDNVFPEGEFEGEVQTADLAPGLYFCRMRAGEFTTMRKILVVK